MKGLKMYLCSFITKGIRPTNILLSSSPIFALSPQTQTKRKLSYFLETTASPPDEILNHIAWTDAENLVKDTVIDRKKWDHRAHKATLLGLYHGNGATSTCQQVSKVLIAVQPDRACGRKLIFMDSEGGEVIGNMLLEIKSESDTLLSSISATATSSLRGMQVVEKFRNRRYSSLFLEIWLRLCLEANVTPATNRINKPLLALTLIRSGFEPMDTECIFDDIQSHRCDSIMVEVSSGTTAENESYIMLYSPTHINGGNGNKQTLGLSATELRSQHLVISQQRSNPPGKSVYIRTQYEPPTNSPATTRLVLGSRLRLSATQADVESALLTPLVRERLRCALTGRI